MKSTLDEIALTNRGYRIRTFKRVLHYTQTMQSLYGSRKFHLVTYQHSDGKVAIELHELKNGGVYIVGTRTAKQDEEDIQRAIKSLERKAKCKLYYVLLISTDGDYL